ncbi:MAG: type II toxin-antitoxin system death-on-curing family toxin [Anaerolineales bacterium]|nr:type II toxin-antitoxin system death-on-curing family toxin [Anaerolineales bacterium]
MEEPREQAIELLSLAFIVRTNKFLIERTGGTFNKPNNLINANSLHWVLETIQHPVVFNQDRYPTLYHKAALLGWSIINDRVFYDGNKRTGMISAQIFLMINGLRLRASDEEIEAVALSIVAHRATQFDIETFTRWIEARVERLP